MRRVSAHLPSPTEKKKGRICGPSPYISAARLRHGGYAYIMSSFGFFLKNALNFAIFSLNRR